MRLPQRAHTDRPWRIHAIAPDFRVEDVWALPTPGGPDDFPRLVRLMATIDPTHRGPAVVRALFALRWKLGGLLGWDAPRDGLGRRVRSLRERLPDDLEPGPAPVRFSPLFLAGDEWAAEIANDTMHGVLHVGWVEDGASGHRGQMAVLVKPNGRLGRAYMAAILPFRHLLVYPALLRELEREWRASA